MKTVVRTDERILSSDIFDRDSRVKRPDHGSWAEPGKNIPVYHRCGVLVVGGGPSGTAAAAAAARAGADVALLERYNHLGGLSTGGLVIWIDRMTDWEGKLVIRGFAEELFDRLPADAIAGPQREDWGSQDTAKAAHWSQRTAAYHGVVTWSPTIDPERLKLLSQEIVLERKVKLIYHSWAAIPIVQDGAVKGVVFESKEGRMAIMADVVVDATGDGDLFARAGAAYVNDIEEADVHHCMNTSWLFGGVDMNRWIEFKAGQPEAFRRLHGARARAAGALRAALRLVAQRRGALHGAAPVGLLGARRGRPHGGRSALAPRHGRAPGLLQGACARLRGRLPDAERAADRRAPCAAPLGRGRGAAQPVARRRGAGGRDRRVARGVAEIPEHLHPLRRAGAAAAGRPRGLRPPHLVRPQFARLHARDSAVLDHRPGRGRGGGAGVARRHRAALRGHRRAAVRIAGAGRVPADRGEGGGRGAASVAAEASA
jgi:hypothetical protein